jgi:hypothetical protein
MRLVDDYICAKFICFVNQERELSLNRLFAAQDVFACAQILPFPGREARSERARRDHRTRQGRLARDRLTALHYLGVPSTEAFCGFLGSTSRDGGDDTRTSETTFLWRVSNDLRKRDDERRCEGRFGIDVMAISCLIFHVQRSQDDFQAEQRFKSHKNCGAFDPKVYLRLFQTILDTTAKVSRPYVKKDRL